jgi:hypothetical protein
MIMIVGLTSAVQALRSLCKTSQLGQYYFQHAGEATQFDLLSRNSHQKFVSPSLGANPSGWLRAGNSLFVRVRA